jgi:hypothetical protein
VHNFSTACSCAYSQVRRLGIDPQIGDPGAFEGPWSDDPCEKLLHAVSPTALARAVGPTTCCNLVCRVGTSGHLGVPRGTSGYPGVPRGTPGYPGVPRGTPTTVATMPFVRSLISKRFALAWRLGGLPGPPKGTGPPGAPTCACTRMHFLLAVWLRNSNYNLNLHGRNTLQKTGLDANFGPQNTMLRGHQSGHGSGQVAFSVQQTHYREPTIPSAVGGGNHTSPRLRVWSLRLRLFTLHSKHSCACAK